MLELCYKDFVYVVDEFVYGAKGKSHKTTKRKKMIYKLDIVGIIIKPWDEGWGQEKEVDPITLLLVSDFQVLHTHYKHTKSNLLSNKDNDISEGEGYNVGVKASTLPAQINIKSNEYIIDIIGIKILLYTLIQLKYAFIWPFLFDSCVSNPIFVKFQIKLSWKLQLLALNSIFGVIP